MEKHYTLQKAAELLGVTTQTLRNWDNAGKIRAIRTPGNQRRIPESEINRLSGFGEEEYSEVTSPVEPVGEVAEPVTADVLIIPVAPVVEAVAIAEKKDSYQLMCKDIAVYDITQGVILNESLLPGCMLKGTMDFAQWMETRYSRDTNFSAERLMNRAFGSFNHETAQITTGAFSLSDCYWLKRTDDDMSFMDITPYIHKEWDGLDAYGAQNDYIWGPLSNLFVSGKTDKKWLDAQTLLKVGLFKELEPYYLCEALGLTNHAQAQKTDEGIILSNFTSTEVFYESMEQFGVTEETPAPRYTAVESFKEQAVALFVIDYLIENNDRFEDDYGFLRNADTGDYISMAPYYNFDWVWSGSAIPLPENAWQGYKSYIQSLCYRAINIAKDFEYGSIIERRAGELLHL